MSRLAELGEIAEVCHSGLAAAAMNLMLFLHKMLSATWGDKIYSTVVKILEVFWTLYSANYKTGFIITKKGSRCWSRCTIWHLKAAVLAKALAQHSPFLEASPLSEGVDCQQCAFHLPPLNDWQVQHGPSTPTHTASCGFTSLASEITTKGCQDDYWNFSG